MHSRSHTADPVQLGIYVHIPFCQHKCFYCDFNSGPVSQAARRSYLRALEQEIVNSPWRGTAVKTLFLGGGTPSELTRAELEHLMTTLKEVFIFSDTLEQTIECNPGTLNPALVAAFRGSGLNRISLGIQSFHNHHLQTLGRIHSADQAREAYQLARNAGFDNINLDLIFGLPNQSLEEWKADLYEAIGLSPEHLSLYNLTIEPGTEFGHRQARGEMQEIDEDLSADMYEMAMDITADAGYEQYEISNYCRPDRQCAHNRIYWHNEPYLGFGVSAASFIGGIRSTNTASLAEYGRTAPRGQTRRATEERLEGRAALGEEIMLRIRTREGISLKALSWRYQCDVAALFSDSVNLLLQRQLIEKKEDRIRLTRQGKLLANQVCLQFL